MLNFIWFILFGIFVFSLTIIGYKKYHSTTLYALAIGGVVNANFFHAEYYPIYCFDLPFGIDSIIYTLFSFCVCYMYIKKGKKEGYTLTISSVVAIIISSIFQFMANLLSIGFSMSIVNDFLSLTVSAISSLIAAFLAIYLIDKLKNKYNEYILLSLGIIIISVVNSSIYYPLSQIIYGATSGVNEYLLASYIGKIISIGFSVISLFILNKLERKN